MKIVTEKAQNIQHLEACLRALSPVGYFYALRIGFAFPTDQGNTYSTAWVESYTQQGLFFRDPVMRWAYANSGVARWSEIDTADGGDVLEMAKDHGLNFGCVASVDDLNGNGRRSILSIARSDREFSDSELQSALDILSDAHTGIAAPRNMTMAELEALSMVKNGLRLKEIAFHLGVTEGAVKQRLKNAKTKLGATTSAQAASLASSLGLV